MESVAGIHWSVITIVGVALLAIVLFWAMSRNKAQGDAGMQRTEEATDRLYKEEDAARDPMDDGTT